MSTLIDYEIQGKGLMEGGEMQANDTILLSFLYGYTGQKEARTLGYYYHSPGSYGDIVFKDIAEVLQLDYYNGKAKVQYQLDDRPTWYDANFDYKDMPFNPNNANSETRRGDDAYNTLNVYNYYGDRLTAIRGLTFKLSIPKDKEFGFYLRTDVALSDEQKTKLTKLGVTDSILPKYSANYSCASMNTKDNNFRSAIAIYDNFTFMGIDDDLGGGDFDCNDVTFALSNSKGEKYIPEFTESTKKSEWNKDVINKHPEYINPPSLEGTNLQSWTLAFENAGLDNDYDFNDVVLKVTPDTQNGKAEVKLLATGAQRKTEVYFNRTLLGEVHELFGVSTDTFVNTTSNTATTNAVTLTPIDWPNNTTMEKQRMNFSLKVYNDDGTSREFSMDDLLNGKSPQALCVAGDWKWPKERINVFVAYPLIGKWGVNFNNPDFYNWYSQPKADAVVTLLEK